MTNDLSSVVAALICLVLSVGCGSPAEQTKKTPKAKAAAPAAAQRVQFEVDGNTAIERIDINNDKRPDVYKFYRVVGQVPASGKTEDMKKVLIRKEMDVNFDQKIDIVQYYAGESGKEALIRAEMDLDFDGRVDTTRHYKGGYISLVELDLGFDGRTDTWRYYQLTKTEDGKAVNRLVEKRRDTNGDGGIDVWEYYTRGKITKIGYDTTGDGAPDRFKRLGKKKK
ncbi:MAG: hypothetical protein KC502_03880 [Myxococcales bacterium]|nr:hypothetical protein [Myxococcales bacterium]